MGTKVPQNYSEDIKKFLTTSREITNTCELTQSLLATTRQFGVDFVMFIEFKKVGEFLVPTKSRGNISATFGHRYLQEELYKIDPFILKASTDLIPFTWHEVFKDQRHNGNTELFEAVCHEFGMVDGFAVPSHCSNGAMGMISFMGPLRIDHVAQAYMQQLAIYYRAAMKRLNTIDEPEPAESQLTPRQLECIQWIAEGKSDWEIGVILGLSESTINRHVERAKERLGVRTRMQVVVKALRSGQFGLDDGNSNSAFG
jgi:DNA-binding CsgD family transcriptional regulator